MRKVSYNPPVDLDRLEKRLPASIFPSYVTRRVISAQQALAEWPDLVDQNEDIDPAGFITYTVKRGGEEGFPMWIVIMPDGSLDLCLDSSEWNVSPGELNDLEREIAEWTRSEMPGDFEPYDRLICAGNMILQGLAPWQLSESLSPAFLAPGGVLENLYGDYDRPF